MPKATYVFDDDVFNLFSYSPEDLNRIAVYRNSVIGRLIHHPHIERFDVLDRYVGDWTFQWVATLGKLNHGVLILKPTNRRTKQLVVVGRAIRFIREFGVDPHTAERLTQATWGVRHSAREEVLGLICESLTPGVWDGFDLNPKDWIKEHMTSTSNGWDRLRSLHVDKITSAKAVVDTYHELRLGTRTGPAFPRRLLTEALNEQL